MKLLFSFGQNLFSTTESATQASKNTRLDYFARPNIWNWERVHENRRKGN